MHLPSALLPAARPLPHEKRVLCFQPRAARLHHRRPPPCRLHRLLFLLLRRRLMSLPPPPPPLSAAPHPWVAGSARGTSPAGAAEQGDQRDLTGGSRTSLRREQGGRHAVAGGAAVRPGVAGQLTGIEYSRVGSTAWVRLTSTVTTRTAVELAHVHGNYPTHSE